MKKPMILASLVLVGALSAACGGGDGGGSKATEPPKDASTADFCKTWMGLENSESGSDVAEQLSKVGTPEEMPADARKGFEVMLDLAEKAGDDASDSELEKLGDEISKADEASVVALFTYVSTECAAS